MKIMTPDHRPHQSFDDAKAAVALLTALYAEASDHLNTHFRTAMEDGAPDGRVRAFYPEIRFTTSSYAQVAKIKTF